MKNEEYEYDAINLLRTNNNAILSTISKSKEEYPFGSFVTYVTGKDRTIYLYLSDIAEHTKNFKNNFKSCLTISSINNSGDKQESKRLTLMGNIKSINKENIDMCEERFHNFFPESKKYADFHSFNFYQLNIIHARWIGGFGKICWLDNKEWIASKTEWNDQGIINHMNQDHQNTISNALNGQFGFKDDGAKMILLTKDGYYLKSNGKIFFIQFDKVCTTSKEYREELISLAKKYN